MTRPTHEQTAQDLRSASLVVEHAGHTVGEFVNARGEVCADGAIKLATGEFRLVTSITGDCGYDLVDGPWTRPWTRHDRTVAAEDALAPLLSTNCENRCPSNHWDSFPSREEYHRYLETFSQDRKVTHYNDFICRGGEELVQLFIEAAEKLEAEL